MKVRMAGDKGSSFWARFIGLHVPSHRHQKHCVVMMARGVAGIQRDGLLVFRLRLTRISSVVRAYVG